MACAYQLVELRSVGVRPGRFMLEAAQEMLTEFMNAELKKLGIPSQFTLTEPESVGRAWAEMDQQLFEAFLGVKR